jgi:hypothetical protein
MPSQKSTLRSRRSSTSESVPTVGRDIPGAPGTDLTGDTPPTAPGTPTTTTSRTQRRDLPRYHAG